MNIGPTIAALGAGLVGVVLGAWLTRRNEKQAASERLLVEALSDALRAIAEIANGAGSEAQAAYASALSRLALHASPAVIGAFRAFQADATTVTADGRRRLLAALAAARAELGQPAVSQGDLAILLFGPNGPPLE
jgi:hypothetical protein